MTHIAVRMYQHTQAVEAGAYVHDAVAKGEVAAAFVYSESNSDADEAWGNLHVYMPSTYGFTYTGHEAIKAKFWIGEFRQKERIVLWIKDSSIEEALQVVGNAIAKDS
jgi:hypothetical protein